MTALYLKRASLQREPALEFGCQARAKGIMENWEFIEKPLDDGFSDWAKNTWI
jgi:hypothetical protein